MIIIKNKTKKIRRVKKKMKGVKKEKSNENWWKLMIVIENCW